MHAGRQLLRMLSSKRTLLPTWRTKLCRMSFCSPAGKTNKETTYGTPKYQLKPIDKFFLVVTGTMKRGEIPNEVSFYVVEKAQNRRRIMVNVFLIILTIIGCAYVIKEARYARDTHTAETLKEKNLKRLRELREEAKKD